MELFQDFVFTISFSFIVSLLIAKLFSVVSSCDDGNSTVSSSITVEEKEWVVCDSEKRDHDQLEVTESIVFGSFEDDLGPGVVIDDLKNVGGVAAGQLFDESSHRTKFEKNSVGFIKSDHDQLEVTESTVFGSFAGDLGPGVVIDDLKNVGGVAAGQLFDESSHRTEFEKNSVGFVKSDEGYIAESVLGSLIQQDCVNSIEVDQELSANVDNFDDDDDDWQGIETTDLEKTFGAAVAFMASKTSADRLNLLDNDVKIQLYGLHRVANEGSCFEPQPMALKVSARANWNAWKRLENLGRDDAMEQYIDLLSRHVPDWMETHASEKQ